jgi:hypothetical protein
MSDLLFIVLLLCEFLFILFGLFLIWSWLTQTPFYPSSAKDLEKLFKSGKLKLPKNIKFIDVGSGDGRIVLWAAKKGFEAYGIEYNPFLSLLSKVKILITGKRKNAIIYNKDFNKQDFGAYNVAYLYIFNEHMDKIKDKLFKEMQKNGVIISKIFKFSNIEPDEKIGKFNIYYVK